MRANRPTGLRSGALSLFQDAFDCALLAPAATLRAEIAALTAQPAFAVYRNTVASACIDALRDNYPAVARLAGEQWFHTAASAYVRQSPPTDPTLTRYGAGFSGFLTGYAPAAELPYLPDVARLDRFWTEAHIARNDSVLDPAEIADLAPGALASAVLRLHAAARWAWFPAAPVYTIWSRNRFKAPLDGELEWEPEGASIARPRNVVQWNGIDAASCAFLDACAQGRTILMAANAALEVPQNVDLKHLMSTLLSAGVFSQVLFPPGFSARCK